MKIRVIEIMETPYSYIEYTFEVTGPRGTETVSVQLAKDSWWRSQSKEKLREMLLEQAIQKYSLIVNTPFTLGEEISVEK